MAADEFSRRLVHASGAIFPTLYLADLVSWPGLRLIYLAGTALAVALEVLRLGVGVDWWVYRELTREYEVDNPAGYALYVVGSAAVVLAFEPVVAVPAVLALAIVDPVSGVLSAPERRPLKRPHVLVVTFALAGTIAAVFVPLPAALAAAAATTVADGATPVVAGYVIDDNIGIPVGSAIAMWAVLQLPL